MNGKKLITSLSSSLNNATHITNAHTHTERDERGKGTKTALEPTPHVPGIATMCDNRKKNKVF